MNEGKRWEDNFRKSLNQSCIRLYDTTNGFAGIKNPCDFIYYKYPYQFMFELKSIGIERLDFCHITENQWKQLSYFNKIKGINSVLCVEYRLYKECYAIPFEVVERVNKSGKRSINREFCIDCEDIYRIPALYKRTNCIISGTQFDNLLMSIAKESESNETKPTE